MRIERLLAVVFAAAALAACSTARDVEEQAAENRCNACHGFPPPPSAAGETNPTDPGVGAHARHFAGGVYSNGFACTTCHVIPTDLGHIDGVTPVDPVSDGQRQLPADLGTYTPADQSCAVYCHAPPNGGGANTTPSWTDAAQLGCTDCHAARTPGGGGLGHTLGDINGSGRAHALASCETCHLGYAEGTTVDLDLHVNGVKNVRFTNNGGGVTELEFPASPPNATWSCLACHTLDPSGHPRATPIF
jgi:predicted CxxxxCH...CXXCH cytochrome family protein